jgi:hypothetical protein
MQHSAVTAPAVDQLRCSCRSCRRHAACSKSKGARHAPPVTVADAPQWPLPRFRPRSWMPSLHFASLSRALRARGQPVKGGRFAPSCSAPARYSAVTLLTSRPRPGCLFALGARPAIAPQQAVPLSPPARCSAVLVSWRHCALTWWSRTPQGKPSLRAGCAGSQTQLAGKANQRQQQRQAQGRAARALRPCPQSVTKNARPMD